jgi:hypothetical protein
MGGGLVGGDAVEEPVEVGAGERPVERCGGGVVAILEGEYPFGEGASRSVRSLGVSTLRWRMEKKISSGSPGALLRRALRTGYVKINITGCMSSR